MAAARSTLADNFKPGHLLYGLENLRELVRLALEKIANPDDKHAGKIPVTVDKMNALVLLLKNPTTQAETIAWLKGEATNAPNGMSSGIALASMQKHFAVQTAASKKVNVNNNVYPKNRKNLSLEARIIRRACKAALEGYPIHFILEGLDARHVFSELYSISQPPLKNGEGRKCFYDSHTSAELRQAIKNIKKLNIKFYCRSKNFEAEVTALVIAAGSGVDAMQVEYEYLRSGKAFVEVDLYTWLARKDLAYERLASAGMKALGPVQAWLTAKRDQKAITNTPVSTLESRKEALRATFVPSPDVVAGVPALRAKERDLDIPDDLDGIDALEVLPASGAEAAVSAAGASEESSVAAPAQKRVKTNDAIDVMGSPSFGSVSSQVLFHHAHQTKAQGSPQVGAVTAAAPKNK